jgi:hypothetical protein
MVDKAGFADARFADEVDAAALSGEHRRPRLSEADSLRLPTDHSPRARLQRVCGAGFDWPKGTVEHDGAREAAYVARPACP